MAARCGRRRHLQALASIFLESAAVRHNQGLTAAELASIVERCETATPGPWKSYVEGRDHESGSSFIMTGEGAQRGRDIELTGATLADQDFIAHARQDIPRLVAEVERLLKFIGKP